jgi:dolichol-phosphate mannosyltransferase
LYVKRTSLREAVRFSSGKGVYVRLLIAIPVHNEQKYVNRVIDKIRRFHEDILVVDDGSTDQTPEFLAARSDLRVIRHAVNLGYGQSLIDAFAYADKNGYDWVITMDCDEQHEPEKIPAFIEAIREDRWDIISGSRYLTPRGDDDLPPGDRRNINATITAMLNDLLNLGITDAFCGYKAHRVSAMRRLRLTERGYAFPLQLWPQVWSAGLRLTELPVRLIYNDPNRHFGGNLDDAENRLRHYLNVLKDEVRALQESPLPTRPEPDSVRSFDMCCCLD